MRKPGWVRGIRRAGRGRSSNGRKLRVESLEQRKMLAGDACNFLSDPIDDVAAIEGVFQSHQNEAATFTTSDAAGNSLGNAADLGEVRGTLRRDGRLSRFDRIDVVRFYVDGAGPKVQGLSSTRKVFRLAWQTKRNFGAHQSTTAP